MSQRLDARLRDGIAAARAKRTEEARTLLQEATEAAPDNPVGWFWLAVVAPTSEAAIAHLRRVLVIDPAHTAARDALAKLLIAQADRTREMARRLFREVAVVAPRDNRIWHAAMRLANTPADALVAIRDLLTVAPDMPAGRQYLLEALVADARAQAAAGRRDVARQRWQEATAIDDRHVEAWIGLAESSDDDGAAREALDRAAAIAPRSPRVLLARQAAAPDAIGPTPTPGEPTVVASRPTRTVLVIDDSPTIRKILSLTLEGAGYTVVAEADGESALRRLTALVPDVILLDIAMPGIDGYETCRRIKADPRVAHLPVLMLSGKDALFDKVKGHMAGATEYLTKPFEAATVLAAVAGACAEAA